MTIIQLPIYLQEIAIKFNYGVSLINAPSFWKNNYLGTDVITAVIDSGCFINHTELKENILDVYNFTDDDNGDSQNVTDYLGHGTHTAGIIAAKNYNSIVGVAPESKLLILKVMGKNGGEYENLIKAINYAVEWRGKNNERVDIINLSLGGKYKNKKLKMAINKAINNKVYLVAAAGNYGDGSETTNELLYPGFYKEVIQVGSIDRHKRPAFFSNTNINIDFVAPGQSIYSTYKNGDYAILSGTSMSSPHVSGAIALLLNFFKTNNINPTQEKIYQYLANKALIIEGYSSKTQGHGIVQL